MKALRISWQFGVYKWTRRPVYIIRSRRTKARSQELSLEAIKQLGLLAGTQAAFDILCAPLCSQSILDQED